MIAGTAALLERAADDEATLHLDGVPEIIFGQHLQQAIEKLIKALINERGEEYPHTHDLDRLVRKLSGMGEALPAVAIRLDDLTDYAIDFRYDDSSKLAPLLDRKLCIDAVEIIRTHVLGRIQALGSVAPSEPQR